MIKRSYYMVIMLLATVALPVYSEEFNVGRLEDYRYQKLMIESSASSRMRGGYNNSFMESDSEQAVSYFYNSITLPALLTDYKDSTQGLRSYLSDLKKFKRNDQIVSCLGNNTSIKDIENAISKAASALDDVDSFMQQPVSSYGSSYGNSYQSRFGFVRAPAMMNNGQVEMKDLKERFSTLDTELSYLKDCCVDANGEGINGCQNSVVDALNSSKDYSKLKAPRMGYPQPPANLPADEFAFFITQDPIMQDAIERAQRTGDYSIVNSAWNQVQNQCLKDKEYILTEEIKRRKQMLMFQDFAKTVQCTLPSILTETGSYTAFQVSLFAASIPYKTETHQFGCDPRMLSELANIRTKDHAILTERYGTNQIVPQWVYKNPNDIKIQRRSYAEKVPNGWATSSGFLMDIPENAQKTNPRSQAPVAQQNPFLSNIPVNAARGPASSRIAQSRGNVPRSRGGERRVSLSRKIGLKESQQYVLSARKLASKIENGQDAEKSARLLAAGVADTRQFVRRVAGSLEGRGSGKIRDQRRSLAEKAKFGIKRAAVARGASSGSRTSARDTLAFFQDLMKSRANNNSAKNTTPNSDTSTPVVNKNTQPQGNGNLSNWDDPSKNPAPDPWAQLRKTQAALDSQITAKNNYIDNLVKEINRLADQFGNEKRNLIAKYTPVVINNKIAGKTPNNIVDILSGVRKSAFNDLTGLGALNSQINELKGKLAAEEASLGNLFMLRGSASGNNVAYNPSPLLQNLQPPIPTGLPQVSPFTQNQNLPTNTPVPRTNVNLDNMGWSLMDFMIPKSWALPGLEEKLASFEVWKKSVEQYVQDLDVYSQKLLQEQENVKEDLYEAYSEYYWLEENPDEMTELRTDLVAGINHYNKSVKEEIDSLLLKMRASESADGYDRELIGILEKAKNDATESQEALYKILKMYIESYPAALEDNPDMWWSQVSNLLLY